ncbi:unknown [Clostridium sp. CAG:433]|nr:unknown [Clostridium sp. CAG:433]
MLEILGKACDIGEGRDAILTMIYYVKLVLRILQIAVPIGLILFGTIDMAKAVIAGDEKKMKEAQKPFIKRIVSAVIVFLIPYIVSVVVGLVTSNGDYKGCWDAAEKAQSFDVMSTNSK